MPTPNSPEVWQTVLDLIPFPIYIADVNSHAVITTNEPMRKRTGGVDGKPCYKAIYLLDAPCPFCRIPKLRTAQGGDRVDFEVVFEHFNESDDRWYQLQERLITWFDGTSAKHSIAVDISALKAVQNELAEAHAKIFLQNRELQVVSTTDRLTGLSNRRKLDEALTKEMERCARYVQPLSVVMMDIDHFKQVNDVHGHPVGDRVLVAVAQRLHQAMRKIDVIGRWGGEEFLVICPNTVLEGAVAMAENLRQLVQSLAISGVGCITSSFGVVQLEANDAAERLIVRADAALYRAKALGRNRVESG